jgi:hypothetical protein
MRRRLIGLLATVAVAGCTSSTPTAGPATTSAVSQASTSTSASASTSTSIASRPAGEFDVQPLGLTFTLPTSFHTAQDPSLTFIARSTNPRALFTIDYETPDVTATGVRPGERLSTIELGGLRNVVVTHAALSGLPAGVDSNELRVSNGTRSFSVIMSAATADLPAMWQTFIESVHVDPA